jgi:hypothetical protein
MDSTLETGSAAPGNADCRVNLGPQFCPWASRRGEMRRETLSTQKPVQKLQ